MTLVQAVILGAVQGLTEFLPVSSSGHLKLVAHFLGNEDLPLLFDIILHIGTLVAVFVVFWPRISYLLAVFFRWIIRRSGPDDTPALKFIVAIFISTAVTAVFGLALRDLVAGFPVQVIPVLFLVTAGLLILSDRLKPAHSVDVPGPVQALIIGVAQGVGIFPGISRSGSTIAASLLCGVNRRAAGEFSFILSIPAILGALILELRSFSELDVTVSMPVMLVGVCTSFAVGFAALKFLLVLIRKGRLAVFAFYLIPGALVVLGIFASGYLGVR